MAIIRNFSTLPTFHPVQMERTYVRSQERLGTPAQLAERRAAWLAAQGLPEKATDETMSPIGRGIVKLLKKGL